MQKKTYVAAVAAALVAAIAPAATPPAGAAEAHPQLAASRADPIGAGAGYRQPQGSQRVRALQRQLVRVGEHPGPIDGRFGPLTEAAVRDFQRHQGLAVDGIAGRQTSGKLERVLVARSERSSGRPRSERAELQQQRARKTGPSSNAAPSGRARASTDRAQHRAPADRAQRPAP